MANTLATKKQSAAIRQQMQRIRNDLPYDADAARAHVQQLTDWKYHVRKNPWPILTVAAVVGYLLIPAKSKGQVVVHTGGSRSADQEAAPQKSMLGGMVGAMMAMALRTGTNLAIRHVSDSFFGDPAPKRTSNDMPSTPPYNKPPTS
ncbi:hypothetical protein NHH03_24400 [Stieleria sp. TO1_6]|uniref:hypothetical protein n=1 Tax=Stieleria tagensis TaxID=2956795 RepID=UPI00209AFCC5|nr:hypothetical protein [Stieleria tagensis]MCO8124901.1 hypothetical protein [Stieleria tagensis]